MTADWSSALTVSKDDLERVAADLAAPVAIRTPNPPGDELEAALWVRERLEQVATSIEIQNLDGGRGNAVATFDFAPGPTIAFNTHLDVVPPESPAPWVTERRDGRGICDAKGALAAMMAAAERLVHDPRGLQGRLVPAAVADEGVLAEGTRAVDERGLRPDAAIVGEPPDNQAVMSSRGALSVPFNFHGRTAHSRTPELGANAIYQAARFVRAVEALDRRLSRTPVPPTCAATVIHSGSKLNIIPDECTVLVDRRLVPGERAEEARREVKRLREDVAQHNPQACWELEQAGICLEAFELAETDPSAKLVLDALGQNRPGPMFPGGADAPHLIAIGAPSIILGPGSLVHPHTADESLALDSLLRGVDAYEKLGRALLRADALSPQAASEGTSDAL